MSHRIERNGEVERKTCEESGNLGKTVRRFDELFNAGINSISSFSALFLLYPSKVGSDPNDKTIPLVQEVTSRGLFAKIMPIISDYLSVSSSALTLTALIQTFFTSRILSLSGDVKSTSGVWC